MTERKSNTIPDFYQYYLTNIERDTVYDVDYTTYRKILTEYFKYLMSQVMDKSREIKLPCRLGTLSIVKRRPKNYDSKSLRIDYKESKEQGKIIYFINDHSDFFKYRFYWNKQNCMTPNKSKYQFVATRANKRRLAQIIKNRLCDYVEIK